MAQLIRKEDALEYHRKGRPGKIEVIPSKETKTQRDLALAYSPGVADPCLEIAANKEDVYKYTAKGNLVAVAAGSGMCVVGWRFGLIWLWRACVYCPAAHALILNLHGART